MNFKKHKYVKKFIRWASPKGYQERHRNPNSNPAKLPQPKAKYCKKLKGLHQYGAYHHEKNPIFPNQEEPWWTRHCIGCDKQDLWFPPGYDYTLSPPID